MRHVHPLTTRPLLIPLKIRESGRVAFLPLSSGIFRNSPCLIPDWFQLLTASPLSIFDPIRSMQDFQTQPNPALGISSRDNDADNKAEENRLLFRRSSLGIFEALCNFFVATLGKKK
jgi:hypothetical protein